MICVTEKDLPDLYQEADSESKAAQHSYLQVFGGILGTTVLGAAATWYATDFDPGKVVVSGASVLLMLIAFALTYVISDRHYDQTWYMGRAVAESVKTRSWSYMMRSEPYLSALSTVEVNERFVEDLRKILEERGPLRLTQSLAPSRGQISEVMRNVRALETFDRLAVYLQCRITDQKQWYGSKASQSSNKERRAFFLMQLSQLVAIVVGAVSFYNHRVASGSVGVLAALSGCILAWLQVKKYQETAQSYSIAHEELGLIETLATDIRSEEALAKFVQDAENAVSREHTLWIAKRAMR